MRERDKALSGEILSGWKDIANYLGRGVRTVQRYERELSFPVRRPAGKSKGLVIATKAELAAWVAARPIREAVQLTQPVGGTAELLIELRRQVSEFHRLREEGAELRKEVHRAMESLHANLRWSLPQRGSTHGTEPHS